MRRDSFVGQVVTAVARATPATAHTRKTASAATGTRAASQLMVALARATPAFAPGSHRTLGHRPVESPETELQDEPAESFLTENAQTQTPGTWVVIDPHQPVPRRHRREPFRRRLAVVSAGFAVPLLLLVGAVIGRYSITGPIATLPGSKPTPTVTVTPATTPATAPSKTTISPLVAAIVLTNHSADAKGLIPPSSCKEDSSTKVTCTAPAPGITAVIFQTFPNQKALYAAYTAKVAALNGGKFRQNFGDCGAQATYGEVSWNHQFQHSTKYTVGQMVAGTVTNDQAAGRVFCNFVNGLEYMVWTQNDGHLLGYVAGPVHTDVWNWWVPVHHNIGIGGSPMDMQMPGTSPTPTPATP